MAATTTHVVILPSPGMGHLIPIVQFAKTLSLHHRISSTILLPTDGPLSDAQKSFLSAVDHLPLPAVNFDDSEKSARIETRISLTVARSLPSIRAAVQTLLDGGKNIAAFVVDLFGTDAFEIAEEFKIPPYIFFTSTAMALSLFLHLPELDETVPCEYRELPEKLRIPGCAPLHGSDLIDPLQDRTNDAYKWTLHHAKRYRIAEGIFVNTFEELEPGPVKALLENPDKKPAVYPIGPLTRTDDGSEPEPHPCLDWLDKQPDGSVLYVSFGSGGTLSRDQLTELALGLEMSGRRFLWVVRCPSDAGPDANFFGPRAFDDPLAYLPEGFAGARGMVVGSWGPQARVLAHGSIGGFLTHCGWNSTLESVVNGVPMIAWPLYAEQRMNAVFLHEEADVALRVEKGENGVVGRVEISNVVKLLMGGIDQSRGDNLNKDVDIDKSNKDVKEGPMEEEEEEWSTGIRSRMKDLKNAGARAVSENGKSTKLLAQLATKWGVEEKGKTHTDQ